MKNTKLYTVVVTTMLYFACCFCSGHLASAEISEEYYNTNRLMEKTYVEESVPEEIIVEEPFVYFNEEDVSLIALVTMAEAEAESEYGKRLVIDTILNRMDSDIFPNTAYEVIYAKNQFSSMWNGRVDRCYVKDDISQLVREEMVERTNNEVLFFTAGQYNKSGKPLFKEGNHYFSGRSVL